MAWGGADCFRINFPYNYSVHDMLILSPCVGYFTSPGMTTFHSFSTPPQQAEGVGQNVNVPGNPNFSGGGVFLHIHQGTN